MTDEDIEALAIRAAKGNNGGEWATHYTEKQKAYWRQWVKDIGQAVWQQGYEVGYDHACMDSKYGTLPPGEDPLVAD